MFVIVIPNHHHIDNADHSDCVVCLIMQLPTQAAVTFSLIIAICLLFIELVSHDSIIPFNQAHESFRPRAPPTLNPEY